MICGCRIETDVAVSYYRGISKKSPNDSIFSFKSSVPQFSSHVSMLLGMDVFSGTEVSIV